MLPLLTDRLQVHSDTGGSCLGVPWELGWATGLHIAGIPEQGVWRESTGPGCWPWVKMTSGGRQTQWRAKRVSPVRPGYSQAPCTSQGNSIFFFSPSISEPILFSAVGCFLVALPVQGLVDWKCGNHCCPPVASCGTTDSTGAITNKHICTGPGMGWGGVVRGFTLPLWALAYF